MKKLIILSAFALTFVACTSGAPGRTDDTPLPPKVATLDCGADTLEYSVEGTPIKFCYDPAWGEPVVEEEPTVAGMLTRVSFGETFDTSKAPAIWIESSDFVPNDGDSGKFCFDCIQMTGGDEEYYASQFAEYLGLEKEEVIARKTEVSLKDAVRVHAEYLGMGDTPMDILSYYIPFAFEGHHITISGDNSIAVEIDEFVFDIVF